MERLLPESPLVAIVGARGRLTLPKPARQHLSLTEGDRVLIVLDQNTIELIPVKFVSRDNLWSMARSVRSRIESAEDDVRSGRVASLTSARSLGGAVDRLLDAES